MATTVPGLDSTSDIVDTDMLMITHSTGLTEKLSGLEFNKRNRIIIANNLTITGAPLHSGNVVRVHFTADIAGVNGTSAMVINYNGTNYNVKAPSNGSLKNFTAASVDGAYKYLQAYTTLELLFDGTQFVIIGNPVVISSADYTIYTDGKKLENVIANNNFNAVTSNAVYNSIFYHTSIPSSRISFENNPNKIRINYTGYTGNITEKLRLVITGSGYINYVYDLCFGLTSINKNLKWQASAINGAGTNILGSISNVTYDNTTKDIIITFSGSDTIYGVIILNN